jgi:hypothetical protein
MNDDCYIAHNGRRIRVGFNSQHERRHDKVGTPRGRFQLRLHDERVSVTVYCDRKQLLARFLDDLALIQEHFGSVSRSTAARLAIALTANAIRKNKALPDVTDAT